ncbi:DUF3667 domain-containing protein [Phenylobacterium montanum]|uniref:DUF3667 domain-containing protein n=1 Tax=Phenylobacterium montanum TaxID=2823693 RepID=A0A975ITP3_9CAUL|nr:DUF3667 domain-containing protein [Caulobacter sp. S6]QUD86940.1 DUF3667 domain-containing protein [Caulobacter sp. S6]
MTQELETVAAASAGGWARFLRRKAHTAPIGSPCANCETPLQGPWCHACGQLGEDFHRSVTHLVGEVFEGLFHFDGRLWRTLPTLILKPGQLTRDYLNGHRAPQIPPLRLFLVMLLFVFLAGSIDTPKHIARPAKRPDVGIVLNSPDVSDQDRTDIKQGLAQIDAAAKNPAKSPGAAWLEARIKAAIDDPERFFGVIEQWSERFAFLLMPMSTLLLSLIFVFQRRFYVFDHAIFSLHSLSAMGLLLTAVILLDPVTGGLANLLLVLAPVHLFRHMRGTYGSSAIGTLIRMTLLFLGSAAGFLVLILGLISVGLNAMG